MAAFGDVVNDDQEIAKAFNDMGPFKALGVDGLNAAFYQRHWNVVGTFVCNLVKSVFNEAPIPLDINRTLLVLIPKKDNSDSLRLYRSISLCTVVYKSITKVITNRLKLLLPDLIGPAQTSFFSGTQYNRQHCYSPRNCSFRE